MSKHTPGPWTVGARGKYGTHNANIIFSNGGEGSVATVYGLPMHTNLEEVDPKYAEGMANARLIAAAPELLEALREAYGYVDCIPETAAGGDDAAIELARRLRAAIAKATGEPA
jgi:hypothetical protein